ncbi:MULTISPECIES: DUF3892 domain-containing protein [Bradyrhizobium]|uniref:DUF3892 domain-containing protein n=1 Tax=Bradyrhizobium barranii subsp. apii TaxID=2819348 RepID=A0A8T5V2M7_9BRAD|nr:DUF3892 domain-containing protein [Bradyrhizobium barranii]UPT87908.1 DUF3892 domain-containing protein [Bradyrhizobium barranii subsp. apii]UPT96742.1 DUF3892 domain-containing protein [Bradyrhizobium barranii subsp. apii]
MTSPQTRPQTAQIRCVNKRDRPNPFERITHVGGYGSSQWKITQEQAIAMIERREWSFYVSLPGSTKAVLVEVGVSRFGNKYLRTEGDDDTRNNLLSLPECP